MDYMHNDILDSFFFQDRFEEHPKDCLSSTRTG